MISLRSSVFRLSSQSLFPRFRTLANRHYSTINAHEMIKARTFSEKKINEISYMNAESNHLSFEKFKNEYMPTFEECSEKLKKFRPGISVEAQQKIYSDTCYSQYKNYIQALTTSNDPGRIL